MDELNASKIKGKVLQNPNLHVVLNVEDIDGHEYIFPFSSVVFIAPAHVEGDEQELSSADIQEMPIDEMKQYLGTVADVGAVRVLLSREEVKEKPLKGAIDLLEAKMASL